MKEIRLTKGKVAIVDDEDFEFLNRRMWQFTTGGYVTTTIRRIGCRKTICMHRLVMNTPDGMDTDHINGNKLDNRKENLRICTTAENCQNQKIRTTNKSGYKGVFFCKYTNKWRAMIRTNYKLKNLGVFKTPEEAALAYDAEAIAKHGKFARTNFAQESE
jgi:hypothetical protein